MVSKVQTWMMIVPLLVAGYSCSSKQDFSQDVAPVAQNFEQPAPQIAQPTIPQPTLALPTPVLPTPVQPTPFVPTLPSVPSTPVIPTPVQPTVITPEPIASGTMKVNAILVHNMEHGRHVVGKDSFAVLRDNSRRVIAAGPIGLEAASNGTPLGMVGAYPGTQLSIALDLLQPGATSGNGLLSLCPVANRSTYDCVDTNTGGNRPIHWTNRSVPYSVQGNIVTVNNEAYGNGDSLQYAVSFAHPVTLAATASQVATLVDASSPLILDLDRNGKLDLLSASSPTNKSKFDLIGDKESKFSTAKTGWIAPQDGFLALDLNGNNKIDSGKELFGEHSFDPAPKKRIRAKNFEHGFKALAIYDDNADKKIDAKDKVFKKLVIWQDKNSDGISQKEEIRSLASTGLKRVYLKSKMVKEQDSRRWNKGNILAYTSRYRGADNRKYLIGDVWFSRERTTAELKTPVNSSAVVKKIKLQKKGS